MKKLISMLTITLFLIVGGINTAFAHFDAIVFPNIKKYKQIEKEIIFLYNNQYMLRGYQITWNFEIPRTEVIKKIEGILEKVKKIERYNKKNIDFMLLKGDIAHFLYNLDAMQYDKLAIRSYERAEKIDKNDYRPVWFLANHYCLSSRHEKGIKLFREILPGPEPEKIDWHLWGDYCDCALQAGMVANSLMGLKYVIKLTKETTPANKEFLKKLQNLMKAPNPDKDMAADEMWVKAQNREIYINYPAGLRICIPKDWRPRFSNYNHKNRLNRVLCTSRQIMGLNNKTIAYTVSIIAKVPQNGEKLSANIKNFINNYQKLKNIKIRKTKLKNPFSPDEIYLAETNEVYMSQGGMKNIFIFFERDEPRHPGTESEYPIFTKQETAINSVPKRYKRFKGKIFYIIILDTCNGIWKKSYSEFKKFINTGIVIE